MAVSKRTRFEVLRRDNHQCRYCGLSADKAPLTIDHVVPVALGGADDPGNLVAACRDCNSGKSSSAPDATHVAQVSEDAVRWSLARAEAARRHVEISQKARKEFLDIWNNWTIGGSHVPLPPDWFATVDNWASEQVQLQMIRDAVAIAMAAGHIPEQSIFSYMLGVMRNKLVDLDEQTRAILNESVDTDVLPSEVARLRELLEKYYYRNGEYGALITGCLSRIVDGSAEELGLAGPV